MEKLRTIKFTTATDQKLEKIALALGRSKRLVFVQMVDYFHRNKKDPTDLNDDLLKNSLSKSHKTYMGFIKSQEDLLLIPIKQGVDKMIGNQRDIVKFFNEQVLGANKTLLKNQHQMLERTAESDKVIKAVLQRMDGADQLKAKFLQILNSYIKSREELGSFKGREKEELAELTRKQVENL
ncbi:BfmA/BtgA family mobilization protein [Pedobacter rhizosphaerae]|uniref:Uncharacterized protein n=1 Tax=Pedobacter rhizosphaerae TaxID=390241 RepID=A0A1H9VQ16_9SPHI|nr:BfmA/BtgA family mobilization protein [Pedobacter rhizosphaerae]SES23323.1 hypothetical protein SAMN04488023_1468 [Pedobacter rhizosphaerae]